MRDHKAVDGKAQKKTKEKAKKSAHRDCIMRYNLKIVLHKLVLVPNGKQQQQPSTFVLLPKKLVRKNEQHFVIDCAMVFQQVCRANVFYNSTYFKHNNPAKRSKHVHKDPVLWKSKTKPTIHDTLQFRLIFFFFSFHLGSRQCQGHLHAQLQRFWLCLYFGLFLSVCD